MRFGAWFCLVLGAVILFAAGVLSILAIQQATEISAYHHARACLASAPSNADCLQAIDGSVAAVTEFPGGYRISPDYALDVRTASTTLHLTFSSDNPMLGYAVNGDPAVVTMWRGVPVSVVTDGRSEATTSVPETAFARELGNSEETGGVGVFFVFCGLAIGSERKAGGGLPPTRPVFAAALSVLLLGAIVVAIGGWSLGGKPSRLGPDLAGTGAALVVVSMAAAHGTAGWLGAALALAMLAIAIVDGRHFLIPDSLNAVSLAVGLVNAAILGRGDLIAAIAGAALRAAFLALSFFALRLIYARLRGRTGIGLGDVKLAAVAGIWLDWSVMPIAVEIAALSALSVYALRRYVLRHPLRSSSRLPFGLYFAPAIWIGWLLQTACP